MSRESDVAIIEIGMKQNGVLSFFKEAELKKLQITQGVKLIQINTSNIARTDEIELGNDCFISGYPKSLGTPSKIQFDKTMPLLRKGIISSINKNQTIILDCQADKGNSGGPVFGIFPKSKQIKLIGLIVELVPDISNKNFQNSGYSVAIPAILVKDFIETLH